MLTAAGQAREPQQTSKLDCAVHFEARIQSSVASLNLQSNMENLLVVNILKVESDPTTLNVKEAANEHCKSNQGISNKTRSKHFIILSRRA
jgi:hypothetical protein